ncbi:hypothetical protein RIF29_17446 [Crotalaria pallida]|uniref:Uncharacterized protein n=1 Tax=Crotalaria pallida TaxID=3830 RepID=A0AAN9IEJ3_CROPI
MPCLPNREGSHGDTQRRSVDSRRLDLGGLKNGVPRRRRDLEERCSRMEQDRCPWDWFVVCAPVPASISMFRYNEEAMDSMVAKRTVQNSFDGGGFTEPTIVKNTVNNTIKSIGDNRYGWPLTVQSSKHQSNPHRRKRRRSGDGGGE